MWCSNSAIPVTRSYPNASHSGFDASPVQLVFGIIHSMASACGSSLRDGSFIMSPVRAQCQHNEMLPRRHTLSVKATPTWDFARAGRCYGRSRSAPTLSVAAIAGSALRRRVLLSFLAERRSASEVLTRIKERIGTSPIRTYSSRFTRTEARGACKCSLEIAGEGQNKRGVFSHGNSHRVGRAARH
jgi:hypothetical protein